MEEKTEKNQFPLITIIIPTYNSAQSIVETLESVFDQKHPALEVIVVDADSFDRTVELAKNFHSPFLRVHSVSNYNIYEMLNCGISLASGVYVSFLLPGDFYISHSSISHIVDLIVDNDHPDLVYGGCLIRKKATDPAVFLHPFSYSWLKKGEQPARLQGCFFRTGVFVTLGKFDLHYRVRSLFDFFCRFYLYGAFRSVSSTHALVDRVKSTHWKYSLFQYFWDTWHVISKNFGFLAAFRWSLRIGNWLWVFSKIKQTLKRSFLGY